MGKIHLSQTEFDLICAKFPGKKGFVNWRKFDEAIEEAFTTKRLEKQVDAPVGLGRTQTFYGAPSIKDLHNEQTLAQNVVDRF